MSQPQQPEPTPLDVLMSLHQIMGQHITTIPMLPSHQGQLCHQNILGSIQFLKKALEEAEAMKAELATLKAEKVEQ